MRGNWLFRAGFGAILLCTSSIAGPSTSADSIRIHETDVDVDFENLGLARRHVDHQQLRAAWSGSLGVSHVSVELRAFPAATFALGQPEAVLRMLADNSAEGFRFHEREVVRGAYGRVGYAAIGSGLLPNPSYPEGERIALGGLVPGAAYSIVIDAKPALSDGDRARVVRALTNSVKARCEPDDPKWTKEEAQARWDRDVRDEAVRKKLKNIRRTKHYIIFTNSSGGALFGKKMEQNYTKIQKTFPFAEVKGRRLMPVFLFKNKQEYMQFSMHVAGMQLPQAAATKGHAFKDYYATWYESPNDPVHIHEATHQIFTNRLHLAGGGSWFQEGVAEYMSTSTTQRRGWARGAAKRARHVPFRKFIEVRQLIANPHLDGKSSYLQAASLIQFLRDGKFQDDKFPAFLEAVGTARRDDADAIRNAVKAVYGTDLAGLEAAWLKYWKK